ncbi:MAG TPA: OmpA family protein [Gammaproteobacteria bacterium]|nr:OmpA family protein [Gammaproteobacteria bacterium]
MGTGCAAHAPQTQYPLANAGRPVKNSQGVCVQIGPTPADGKTACYQLVQPDLKHHVEPLPLDEFGYLFPPLKPESKLTSTGSPAATTKAGPVIVVPAIPITAAPIITAPIPSVPVTATPSIPITAAPLTGGVPATVAPTIPVAAAPITTVPIPAVTAPMAAIARYIAKTVRFSTRLPFKLNSAHLSRKNRAELLAFVNSLQQYRGVENIRITGHTDKSGPARYNKWLSGMRAKSVQLWLLSLGVDSRTTQVRGVGSSEPRPHARYAADNRYVDIEVVVRVPVP